MEFELYEDIMVWRHLFLTKSVLKDEVKKVILFIK